MNQSQPDYTRRESLPLIPLSVDVSLLPPKLRDGDRPFKLYEARQKYIQLERGSWQKDGSKSIHLVHLKEWYPRIHEADRGFQANYSGLTTAKLTRGLSPYDDSGERLTPWELDQMLKSPELRKSVHGSLRYHLREFDFEWVAVTTTTRITGTPREYIYLWIDDPNNELSVDHLSPALELYLDNCKNAYTEDYPFRQDGGAGAITVRHTPPLVDGPPDQFFDIAEESEFPSYANTTGAKFVAQRLAHLPIGDYTKSNRDDPPDAALDGGVYAWMSPYNWFRPSGGLPKL